MASSLSSDMSSIRRRLVNLKHSDAANDGLGAAGGERGDGAGTAPLNSTSSLKLRTAGAGVGGEHDSSGEIEFEYVHDVDGEGDSSLLHSLPSTSSASGATSGASREEMKMGADSSRNAHDDEKGGTIPSGSSTSINTSRSHSRRAKNDNPKGRRLRRIQRKHKVKVDDSSSRWFGYDLSIIIAIISPIGNMLTGGDHVTNILTLLLLAYYLQQLVEVPWDLYRESIPRREVDASSDLDELTYLAHTELKSYELMYLSFTVLSPFLGAMLLRSVAAAVSGDPNILSWFSTSLFVLATGIRPWSHLVERLRSRSLALNEILKESMEDEDEEEREEDELLELRSRVHVLDEQLLHLADRGSTEAKEVFEHLMGVIEGVDKTLRKHRAEIVNSSETQNARVAELEERLDGLDDVLERRLDSDIPPAREIWYWFLHVLWSAWLYALYMSGLKDRVYPAVTGTRRNLKIMGPSGSPLSLRTPGRLESIKEESQDGRAEEDTIDGSLGQELEMTDTSNKGKGKERARDQAARIGGNVSSGNGALARQSGEDEMGLTGFVRLLVKRSVAGATKVTLAPFKAGYYMLSAMLYVPRCVVNAALS